MCNNCNCDAYDQCSIVGYMPVGFCCEKCVLYNAERTCLRANSKPQEIEVGTEPAEEEMTPVETSIEGGLLRVVVKKKGKEIPIYIDLKKQLE